MEKYTKKQAIKPLIVLSILASIFFVGCIVCLYLHFREVNFRKNIDADPRYITARIVDITSGYYSDSGRSYSMYISFTAEDGTEVQRAAVKEVPGMSARDASIGEQVRVTYSMSDPNKFYATGSEYKNFFLLFSIMPALFAAFFMYIGFANYKFIMRSGV